MLPSLSEAVPLKVTLASNRASDGVIESIVAFGRTLGYISSSAVTPTDQLPSLSCTRKEMLWVPTLKPVVLKSSSLLKMPSMSEFHSYATRVPSLSEAVPLKVILASNRAGDGVIESIVAVGGILLLKK